MRRRALPFIVAAGAYCAVSAAPWHDQESVRRAAGIVLATLVLWISEVAPLGVVAMGIPIAATFTGLLEWEDALGAWADPVVFLFLGAFLLARALDKHGVFDWILRVQWGREAREGNLVPVAGMVFVVLIVSGTLSTLQNNTAVTAMLLPITLTLAKRTRAPWAVLIALAWGATFGGMATPVGTAPNFIGFAAMKKIDPAVHFFGWLRVGLPVWIGTTLIGWGVLWAAIRLVGRKRVAKESVGGKWIDRFVESDVGPVTNKKASDKINASPLSDADQIAVLDYAGFVDPKSSRVARRAVAIIFGSAVLLWLVPGLVISVTEVNAPAAIFLKRYLPESLVPLGLAWVMFMLPVGVRRRPLLDRHDFQSLDWDTLFLIAGGLTLGKVLETSGAAASLARSMSGVSMHPMLLMLALAGVTVLLSELTSNTATASLMVPIAGSLAEGLGMSASQAIWLVALAASLGFALPVSTPPNALVYGTRLIPLRRMAATGIVIDVLATIWLVMCVRWFGD